MVVGLVDAHGDGASDLDGTTYAAWAMLPACLSACVPLPAGGVTTDGVGVMADPGSGVVLSLAGGDVGVSLTGGELAGGVVAGGELAGGELAGGELLVAGGGSSRSSCRPTGCTRSSRSARRASCRAHRPCWGR